MASISKLQKSKDSRRFWKIQVSRGRGMSPYSTRFYWPEKKNGDPVSEKKAHSDLDAFVAEFERKCKAGEVLSRKEAAEEKAAADREREKLKTVKQYAEGVWMAKKKLELAETTRTDYQDILDRFIYPVIGSEMMQDVTAAMVNKLLLDFQQSGKSFSYLHHVYIVLSGIFSMAYKDGTISEPVMLRVDKPRRQKEDIPVPATEKALSLEMLNYVLDCLAGEPLKWQAFVTLAADTGARRGELLGLQWSDLDEKKKTVMISRTVLYTPDKGVYVSSPKNGKKRIVDIGEDTLGLLKAWKAAQEAESKEQEKTSGVLYVSPWLFNRPGLPDVMAPDSVSLYFRRFGEKYGVENFHPHLLRHTSASLALTVGGADVVSVSQRLGHSNTAITLRVYSHATDDTVRRAGQGVRNALKTAKKKKAKGGK